MTTFLIYIIRWAIALTLPYSLYGLFLRRETFHGVNRAVLLCILTVSMLLPLITIEIEQPTVMTESVSTAESILSASVDTALKVSDTTKGAAPIQREDMKPVNIAIWSLIAIYVIGLSYCWLRYLLAMVCVIRLIIGGNEFQTADMPRGIKLLSHPKVKVPCSWMRWVMVNPADENNDVILAHEMAHVQLFHSVDMLLAEATANMLWFLPFSWMLRRDLKDIHEYQADQYVIRQGYNQDNYELLLIDRVTAAKPQPVMNALNQSAIKKRLKMLYTKKSDRLASLKAVYLLPLAAIVLTAFAKPRAIDDLEQQIQEAYQIVTEAPGFVPENEKLVLTSVPASPFSLKEAIENEDHHLLGITCGRREMYAEPTDMLRGFNFRHENGETYMQVFGRIDSDEETIWLGGPDTYIVNVTTGLRYKARRALPPADLNCDIVVKGCKGQEFMFTIVFPDLPKGSWNARIYGVPYCQLRGGAGIPDITKYFEN